MAGIKQNKNILWFKEIRNSDVPLVGGKNASLGEMYSNLASKGVRVPNGFAVTAAAYRYFIRYNSLESEIKKTLTGLNKNKIEDLKKRGHHIRTMIKHAKFPEDLKEDIIKAYRKLSTLTYKPKKGEKKSKIIYADVAVRSSATAEDLPDASFAGQQETYLNIHGEKELLEAVKNAFASLFTDRAISYREDKGFQHMKVALSVGIQLMVRSDKASSGVMFTLDTESGFRGVVLINSIYGLGENIVQGKVSPDEFIIFKDTLKKGYKALISKNLGTKRWKMIYGNKKSRVKNVPVPEKHRKQFSISDNEALQLAKWAVIIEEYYQKPMDIEWAKDGISGKLYIVQARPETIYSTRVSNVLEEYTISKKNPKVIVQGVSVGKKIAQGKAKVILDVKDINQFKEGEVLITSITNPDWEPIMKKASAIVTDSGGRTAHAAIVSRELGIPAIVGTEYATKLIKTGQKITIDCSRGEIGYVYDGFVPYKIRKTNIHKIPQIKTKIMMNIGEPSKAFYHSFIPNDGVGLARLEFIINEYIKVHPLALLNIDKIPSKKTQNIIKKIIKNAGYDNGKDFFIGELAEGIAKIGAAFYPKDVIVRLSDFKTNEYQHLIGGEYFEPTEQNPMLGWRGASRYYDEKFRPAFDMECAAFKKVREEVGLKNIKIMIPFVRTLEEAEKVLQIMNKNGLKQGKQNLEIYMMVEIPSNIILADKFAQIFDGFSIGSNDLTQLTLGVDRDSELVSHIYDERNEAVKTLIKYVIEVAKKYNVKIGICGQGPSDFPDFAEFLAKEGIDSMSLNPDTVLPTRYLIAKNLKK